MKNVFIGLLLSFFVTSCTVTEDVTFNKVESINLVGISEGSLNLVAQVSFNNPNDYSVTIKSIDCDVYVDEKKVSELHQKVSKVMPSKNDFSLPIDVEIPTETFKNDIKSILSGFIKRQKTVIKLEGELEGELEGDLIGISFSVPFVFEEEKSLRF